MVSALVSEERAQAWFKDLGLNLELRPCEGGHVVVDQGSGATIGEAASETRCWFNFLAMFKRRDIDTLRAFGAKLSHSGIWEVRVGGEGCSNEKLPSLVSEAARLIRSDGFRSARTAQEHFRCFEADLKRALPRMNLGPVARRGEHSRTYAIVDDTGTIYGQAERSENLAWRSADEFIGRRLTRHLGVSMRPRFYGVERRICIFRHGKLLASGPTTLGALDAYFERLNGPGEFLNWPGKYLELDESMDVPSMLDEALS